MIRKLKSISRSLGAIAVLVATTGCPTDDAKNPGQSLQTPTAPFAGIQITMGSNRSMLEVGDDETVAVISVEVLRTADWTPVANGTDAVFTATLGAIDSPSGGRTVTIDLINGRGSITLYPGDTDGTCRVSVNVSGATAVLNITIKPDPTGGLPPEPAPVQSTLTVQATPPFVSEEDASNDASPTTDVLFTATVLGSDGNPFKGAGVFWTTNGPGTFPSGTTTSAIGKTNGAGQTSVTLSIPDADLLNFPSGSFTGTAHLGIEGGERTASVTVTIIAGPAPDAASSIELQASVTFLNDDGSNPAPIALDATVFDQDLDPFPGANVTFSSTLGNPSPIVMASNGSGVATSSLDLSAADVANHPTNAFTITATVQTSGGTATDNVVITIVRTPVPTLIADFSYVATLTTDVDFTDLSTGGATEWRWDFDNDGAVDSTDQNPTNVDFTPLGGAGTYQTKLVIIRAGDGATDTIIKSVTVP